MDIYSFINSKAISDHCRKISHSFTPLEAAYIVYSNDSMNIAMKHSAFREIIKEQPDTEIAERPWTPHIESLHRFLQDYIAIQNKYLSVFYDDDRFCVYSFEVLYPGDDEYCSDERLFTSFKACFHALKAEINEICDDYAKEGASSAPLDIRVKKQWLNNDGDDRAKYITVCIDCDNNPTDIFESRSVISPEDNEILCAFEGLWLEIPTPFQKGDILTARSKYNADKKPFLLDWLPYDAKNEADAASVARLREHGDISDMITGIFAIDDDGTIYREHGPLYLNLEYYEKELCGTEKLLLTLSNYIKGEIPIELLLTACDVFKAEHYAQKQRSIISGYLPELLKKSGLTATDNQTNE